MVPRVKTKHPALKHGGYSAMTILPGESQADFEKLHRDLIDELTPNGPLEDHIVATMARLLWRTQNLATFQTADRARGRREQLADEKVPSPAIYPMPGYDDEDYDPAAYAAAREEAFQAAEVQTRKEFGEAYELVEMGKLATVDGLMDDLDVRERLDSMVDKCVKRLLLVRGVKSISVAPFSAPPKRLGSPNAT
jgi:hypothetical protein